MTSNVSDKAKDSVESGTMCEKWDSKENQESAGKPNSHSEGNKEIYGTQMDRDTSRDRFTRRDYWRNIWLQRENSKKSEVDFRQEVEKLRQTGIPPDKIWEKLHTHGQCPGPVIGLTILEDVEAEKKSGQCLEKKQEFSQFSSGWYPITYDHHPYNQGHCFRSFVTRWFQVETAALFDEFDFK